MYAYRHVCASVCGALAVIAPERLEVPCAARDGPEVLNLRRCVLLSCSSAPSACIVPNLRSILRVGGAHVSIDAPLTRIDAASISMRGARGPTTAAGAAGLSAHEKERPLGRRKCRNGPLQGPLSSSFPLFFSFSFSLFLSLFSPFFLFPLFFPFLFFISLRFIGPEPRSPNPGDSRENRRNCAGCLPLKIDKKELKQAQARKI